MRILIAVDETDFADVLTEFVVNHIWPSNASFMVLHVVEPVRYGNLQVVLPESVLDSIFKGNWDLGLSLVKKVGKKIRNSLKTEHVEEEVIEGYPKEEILKMSKYWKADVIIVGSHGRHGMDRMLMGSVSTFVVTHAHCSVFVMRPNLQLNQSSPASEVERNLPVYN